MKSTKESFYLGLMTPSFELPLVELLCSHLCHDLISPITAIKNGVELIEEMGASSSDEAFPLIAESTQKAAFKLQVMRLVYGAGSGEGLSVEALQTIFDGYFQGTKIKLEWDPALTLEVSGTSKLLGAMILLAEETLAYGGVLHLRAEKTNTTTVLKISAAGRQASLRPETEAAFQGTTAGLTPRTIHAYFTGRLALHLGWRLTLRSPKPDLWELWAENKKSS